MNNTNTQSSLISTTFSTDTKIQSSEKSLLTQKLNTWIRSTPAEKNRTAAAEIFAEVFNEGLDTLMINDLDLTTLPDVFDLETFKTNLKFISFANNRFSDLPASIEHLKILQEIDLSTNPLIVVPNVVLKMTNLCAIALETTQITEIPSALGNLPYLTGLNLSNNEITSLPETLKNLSFLQAINLSNTLLNEIPAWFGEFKKLDSLNIPNNKNLHSLPETLKNCTSLTAINIKNTAISQYEKTTILNACETLRENERALKRQQMQNFKEKWLKV